ncbi:hypothetical protein COOONC_17396 [Cooperia oncophora]
MVRPSSVSEQRPTTTVSSSSMSSEKANDSSEKTSDVASHRPSPTPLTPPKQESENDAFDPATDNGGHSLY